VQPSAHTLIAGDIFTPSSKSLSISPILKLQRLNLPKPKAPNCNRIATKTTSLHDNHTQKCNPTAAVSTRPQAAPHHPPTPPQPRLLPAARAKQTSTARSSCKQASCPPPPDPPTTNCHHKLRLPLPTTATTSSCNRRHPASRSPAQSTARALYRATPLSPRICCSRRM
jgi:hypothetical protein